MTTAATSTTDYATRLGTNLYAFARAKGLPVRALVDGDIAAGVIVRMSPEEHRAYRKAFPFGA